MATEAIVSSVLNKLAILLIEEARLLCEVHGQIKLLETELTGLKCFLKDFDAKQRKGDKRVRSWVAEIIDVSYDAEDVIDTYILNEIARIEQGRRRGLVAYIIRYWSVLTTRHNVGNEIQRIRLKIGDISSRLSTYGIKDINDGGDEMHNLNIRRWSSALYEEPDIIGMQESMITLKEQLMNEEARRCVISIVGMGGSECVMGRLSQEEKENSNEYLTERLRDHLSEKRYLVVIDDIWTMQAWDELKHFLPDGLPKSRVMLTTRNKEVASYADNVINHHYIRLLNEDETWELFHKKVFPKGVVRPLKLMEMGKKIFAKCGGLPLAIVVLTGLLSRRNMTFSGWSKVLDSATWHLAEDSNWCMEILALSYYNLPYYLKPCFLYLGLFPEDYEIKSKELIKLWIAEGFIQQRGNEIMEDVAEDYLEELIGRSMIQVARKRSNGTVSTCRIHDLLRDLSMSEARQVNFFGIYGDDNATTSSSSSLRRVALHRNVDESEIINHSTAALRSILCFSNSSIQLSRLLYSGRRLLRVLHVASLQENNLPKEIGGEVHLRYLRVNWIQSLPSSFDNLSNLQVIILPKLAGCTLPSAIWDLERLRHLYAYGWEIDGHPRLSNFRNLQTLCLGAGSWIEDGLDKLTNLRKLGIFGDLHSHHKALSGAIEKWSSLRSLSLVNSTSIPPFVSFAHHQNLYKMFWEGRIENLPKMPPNLAKLTLLGSRLQHDAIEILEKLQNLRVLRLLEDSYCSEKMICSSEGFPQLEYLWLDCHNLKGRTRLDCYNLRGRTVWDRWTSEEGWKVVEAWTIEEGAMKSLKEVKLRNHNHLKILPKQVKDLLK